MPTSTLRIWSRRRGAAARRSPVASSVALARRAIARNARLHAWLRAAQRLIQPGSAPQPRLDIFDAVADARPDACFVQIGSNDADHGDPLRGYVENRGWRGLMVEPVPYVFERLRARYGADGRIQLVNAAIGTVDGHMPFYYVAESDEPDLPEWYDQIGSFSLENVLHPQHVEHIPNLAERVVHTNVPCVTFETLVREHPLPRLDIVHIDAEGYEQQILAQIDLARLRPLVLLYEHKHLTGERRRVVNGRLLANGYALLDLGPDTLAVRRDAPLLVRLALRRHRHGWVR